MIARRLRADRPPRVPSPSSLTSVVCSLLWRTSLCLVFVLVVAASGIGGPPFVLLHSTRQSRTPYSTVRSSSNDSAENERSGLMTTIPNAQGTVSHPWLQGCSTSGNLTRSLLGYLALAGPFYVAVSLAQALTRPGFSLTRDEWSLLALGPLGWIQMANLILTRAMTVAGAIGVRRAVGRSAPGGVWAPRLLAGYGVALVGAGIFRA